mmetsp:Transcript_20582/g.32794  ORF Transcript_20582/g.32794 Transcript_20582/m.32794 type:complete len:206 (+) Transcript_20582:413-1030(+)
MRTEVWIFAIVMERIMKNWIVDNASVDGTRPGKLGCRAVKTHCSPASFLGGSVETAPAPSSKPTGFPSFAISARIFRTSSSCSSETASLPTPGLTTRWSGSFAPAAVAVARSPTPRNCKRHPILCIMKRMCFAPTPKTALYAERCFSSSFEPLKLSNGTGTLKEPSAAGEARAVDSDAALGVEVDDLEPPWSPSASGSSRFLSSP